MTPTFWGEGKRREGLEGEEGKGQGRGGNGDRREVLPQTKIDHYTTASVCGAVWSTCIRYEMLF